MKKNLILMAFLAVVLIFISSCDTQDDETINSGGNSDSTSTVTIEGKVVAAESGNNLSDVIIKITDGNTVKGTTTNDNGEYSTTFEINSDVDLEIIASKDGYLPDTTSVFVIQNTVAEVSLFQLQKDENSFGGSGSSGAAASINLHSQSANSIGVKESGSLESAEIIFEVRDSSGVLIDESHSVDISFTFGATPGGGEYLYPATVKSNALGKAAVTLNTGSIAGVVQIIAEANFDGKVIKSKPILIAIHGGFPVEDLFYVASEKLNYPYLGIIGEKIQVTALAGDKYHNPVRPGTAIYFTTNSGVIEGSDLTDNLGYANVIISTEPSPNDPVYGAGFFTITASTGTEEGNTIYTNMHRLHSGTPQMTINPTSFNLENGGSQSFIFTVADVNGNPMSEGQTINISIESEFIEVAGATEVKFPDTQSESWTTFSFTAYDSGADTVFVETATIEIVTSGPNTENKIVVTGSAR